MPLWGMLASIWIQAPADPDEMLQWPADAVYHMLHYIRLAREIEGGS
jgi:hypothetical protein